MEEDFPRSASYPSRSESVEIQSAKHIKCSNLRDSQNQALAGGTFVTGNSHYHEQSRGQMLLRHVRHSVDEALALGFSLSDLESATREYIKNREKMLATVRMVFIECNYEQANYFSHHLDLDPKVEIVPLILDDLRQGKSSALQELEKADVVVTSFYHLSEIKKIAEFSKKNIEAVSMEPDVATLIRIARLPSSATLGIVTTSDQFLREIKRSLRKNNLQFDVALEASKSSSKALDSILKNAEAIIVSPGRKREIQEKAKKGVEMIEFVFSPDRTSINNLRITIVELEKAQNKQKG